MRKLAFYLRLAWHGLSKNISFSLPHLLTCAGCAAMFYILRYITRSDMVAALPGSASMIALLYLGMFVMLLVMLFIMNYANNFVMKRRQKELGLYNVLGMEKRQIAHVLVVESLMQYVGSMAIGLAAGLLFSKLALMALLRLMRGTVAMGFSVSLMALGETALVMAVIFLLMLLRNLWTLGKSRPVELLHARNVGEREPKSRWFLAVLGVACLGTGYTIAVTITNPISAMMLFFVAVLLVMIGTWCLFTAISVVVLKGLRRNKRFYYKPRNFTAVSGMLYRMKQNATGLSNICLLATMLLVTISTTVCMYAGSEDALLKIYPDEIAVSVDLKSDRLDEAPLEAISQAAQQGTDASGCTNTQIQSHLRLTFAAAMNDKGFYLERTPNDLEVMVTTLDFLTAEDYSRLTGRSVTLAKDEVLRYRTSDLFKDLTTVQVGTRAFRVQEELTDYPIQCKPFAAANMNNSQLTFFVVADRDVLVELYEMQKAAYGDYASELEYSLHANPVGTSEQLEACYDAMFAAVDGTATTQDARDSWWNGGLMSASRDSARVEYFTMYGGFLFLGVFLGLMFLLATVMMIYYKQLSEGYEDRERFVIMQKVGMSTQEVKRTIQAQVLMIFFLPLLVAAIHVCFAFPMISKMLMLFSLYDQTLFMACTAITLAVFAAVYVAVYAVTARKYYQIVRT